MEEILLKYRIKLILSILGICIFVSAAIVGAIDNNITVAVLCGCAAFVDSFVYMIPIIFSMISVNCSKIDPNMYSYKKSHFVDRKEIYNDIKSQIKTLDKSLEKLIWIRLHGDCGVGKKTLVSKIFESYKYPKNKFYFLKYEDGANVLDLMSTQFPLKNENFSNEIYFKKLSSCKRTFIVINSDYELINNSIIKFMTEWTIHAKKHHKLIFITYDNDISQIKLKNQTYIFEYEVTPLAFNDAMKYSNLLIHNNQLATKIARFSNGIPATIKFICENTRKDFEQKDIIEFVVGMRNELKIKYIQLCTLSLVNNNINRCQINRILTAEECEVLLNSKKLICQGDQFTIPSWMLNYIIFSDIYKSLFIDSIDVLYNNGILSENEKKKSNALITRDWEDILNLLNGLEKNNDYTEIKECYDKLSLDYSCINNNTQTETLLIFMKTLLKIGAYNSFENLAEQTKNKFSISSNMTINDYNYNFLLADFYHLTSQYRMSNDIFQMLLICPFGKTNSNELNFHLAHNLRHQGKLNEAKKKFEYLVKTCNKNTVIYKRAITSLISIEYCEGTYSSEQHLKELYKLLSNEDTDFNVIRHIANVYRREHNDYKKAIKLLEENLSILENKNLRIVQDYYFELAECYRFLCNENSAYYNESITYYNKAILFSELNHDVNLHLCSCIGKSLLMYKKTNDKKTLNSQLLSILSTAQKVSSIIELTILTILSSINGHSNIRENLETNDLKHHSLVLYSGQIHLLHITVM